MKRFLNSLLCLLLSLTLVLSFAACSKDKDENSDDEETSKSDTVKDEDKEVEEDEKDNENEEDEEDKEDEEVESTVLEYYEGTTIPTYTSVTGVELKEKDEDLSDFYVYDYTDDDDVTKYLDAMHAADYELLETEEEENAVTTIFINENEIVSISVHSDFEEVWVNID